MKLVFSGGIATSSVMTLSLAQPQALPSDQHPRYIPADAQRPSQIRGREFTPPTPRGDLRSDILDNAQRRAGILREENPSRR